MDLKKSFAKIYFFQSAKYFKTQLLRTQMIKKFTIHVLDK